jgi:2-oxoisovalerate dehydrogenase E1 component alpha subunit
MGAHTTTDDPTRYRMAGEVESWQARDPIARVKAFITKQQIAGDDFFAEVDELARRESLALRERVLAMENPDPLSIFEHVYPHGSPLVDAQRRAFAEYQDSFEGSSH